MPEEIPGISQRPPVAISPTSAESRFLTRVYGWMGAGLAVTALVSTVTVSSPELLRLVFGNRLVFWGLMLGELGLVAWLSGLVGRMSAGVASGIFLLYSALNGLTLSVVFLVFTRESLASTFVVSAATFGVMSAYGHVTKRSLDGLGSFCFMGLIGVVIATLVNLFIHSAAVTFVTSCVGVIVFVGLTAYDTRRLKMMAAAVDADSAEGRRGAVTGALALYLDFINLFLMLLNLFGRRR